MVVEDEDMIDSRMNGQRYRAGRFAASLRRKLYRGKLSRLHPDHSLTDDPEHLGLIEPQWCEGPVERITNFMRPAPIANDDETGMVEDDCVADPLADSTETLWNETAKRNRDIYTEIFRPIPSNFIRKWDAYDAYAPKTKRDHVAPDIPLSRVKDRLSQVRGSLVECPLVCVAFRAFSVALLMTCACRTS